MINGVEILATQEVVIDSVFNWAALLITFVSILAIYILIGFIAWKIIDDMIHLKVGIIAGTIFGVIFGVVVGFGLKTPVEFENEYKVIVSNEVSMNDFLSKYEIIDQEGKIYTVKEIKNGQ